MFGIPELQSLPKQHRLLSLCIAKTDRREPKKREKEIRRRKEAGANRDKNMDAEADVSQTTPFV